MVWQDIVIAVCQLLFLPAMWPTLRGKDKPAFATSAANALLVGIITFTLGTLHLWFACITASLMALTWGILALQKLRSQKKNKK